jgi:hypothetical protein
MVVTGSGSTAVVHAVWTDFQYGISNSDITYARSTDGGANFGFPKRINTGDIVANDTSETSPDIATSGSYVYIVWKDMSQLQTHVYFKSSSDGGSLFGNEKSIVAATGSDPSPRVEASGSNVYVTWKGKNDEGILAIMSSDNGGSFGSPVTIQGAPDSRISKHPDIAVDSTNVYVTFDYEDVEYGKRNVWVAKSALSSLSFGTPKDVSLQGACDCVNPSIAASDTGVYVAWEDYRNDNDNEFTGDATDDADIFFSKSTNQGTSFGSSVRVNDDSVGNRNQQTYPCVSADTAGNAIVAWTDKRNIIESLQDKDIYFCKDTGSGFTINGRCNDFQATSTTQDHASIGVDGSNVAHCVWTDTRNDAGDIYYSHTIPNTNPIIPVLNDPDQIQETSMRISWQGNIESDFYLYEVHMSNSSGITPGPGTLEETIYTQANTSHTIYGLNPGTRYYFKIVVQDFDGLSSSSNEVTAITFNVNLKPKWLKDLPNLAFEEDNLTQGERILNVSDGYFWDDYYGGYAPKFEVETTASNAASNNIKGMMEKVGTFFYVTFKPKSNFAGTERFWLNLTDNGTDGSGGNADDLMADDKKSFDVTITDLNDPPQFDKINSGELWDKKITTFETLNLVDTIEQGRQGVEYKFTITSKDIDPNDEITYQWYRIEDDDSETKLEDPAINLDNPTLASDFVYVPSNDECTNIDVNSGQVAFNITAKDKAGEEIYFYLTISLLNMNDPPVMIALIDGDDTIDVTKLSANYEFEMIETDILNFSVVCVDIDPGDNPDFYSEKGNLVFKSKYSYKSTYDEKVGVSHFLANFTYTPDDVDIDTGDLTDVKIKVDDKHAGIAEYFFDISIDNINDPPEILELAVKPVFDDNEEAQTWWERHKYWVKGAYGNLNPGEELNFTGLAKDPEKDELSYSWEFDDGNTGSGKYAFHTYDEVGNYTVGLTVSDGEFQVYDEILVQIKPDGDSDNDLLPDKWEIEHFGDLTHTGEEDFDKDNDPEGYQHSNWVEYKAGSDPKDPNSYPGNIPIGDDDDEDDTGDEGFKMPAWLIILIVVLLVIAVFVIVVVILIVKQNRDIEEEDRKMDEWVDKQTKKAEESRELYGLQVAGSQVESSYETSKSVDMNKLSEEEKMFISMGEGKVSDGDIGGAQASTGPELQAAGSGPLFDDSAPKLEFAEDSAIKLDDMTIAKQEDDLVIETVTLGQDEGGLNERLQSAPDRFDNAAEFQQQPPAQQQPPMQPPPAVPPQGPPPQQRPPGQTPGQQGYPPAQ